MAAIASVFVKEISRVHRSEALRLLGIFGPGPHTTDNEPNDKGIGSDETSANFMTQRSATESNNEPDDESHRKWYHRFHVKEITYTWMKYVAYATLTAFSIAGSVLILIDMNVNEKLSTKQWRNWITAIGVFLLVSLTALWIIYTTNLFFESINDRGNNYKYDKFLINLIICFFMVAWSLFELYWGFKCCKSK